MRRSLAVLGLALLLAAALPPPARAQLNGTLTLGVSPGEGSTTAGQSNTSTLFVNSTIPDVVTVHLNASDDGSVTATASDITMLPGSRSTTVRFSVSANATTGDHDVALWLEGSGNGATYRSNTAHYLLHVKARPVFTAALSPSSALASPGGTAQTTLLTQSTHEQAYNLSLSVLNASGYTIAPSRLEVAPGNQSFPLQIAVPSNATAGHHALLVRLSNGTLGNTQLSFDVEIPAPPTPTPQPAAADPPPSDPGPGNATPSPPPTPTNETAPNATAAPADPAPIEHAPPSTLDEPPTPLAPSEPPAPPPSEASTAAASAQDAPAGEAPSASAPAQSAAGPDEPLPPSPPRHAPPRAPRQLVVDPSLVEVRPRGQADVRVVESDLVPVTLEVPRGIDVVLLGQEGGIWTFRLIAAPGALENVTLQARAMAGEASAPFAIRIEAPTEARVQGVIPQVRPTPPSAWPYALAAAMVGGAACALAWANRRWPLALPILYSRIAPSRLLAHPARTRMHAAIAAAPGITVNGLQRELGLAKGVFDHHLHRLLAGGHVRAVADGQLRRLYVAGTAIPGGAPPLSERIVALLHARGEARAADLARELGVSRQALQYHLKRLAREGRLVGRADGRELVVRAA